MSRVKKQYQVMATVGNQRRVYYGDTVDEIAINIAKSHKTAGINYDINHLRDFVENRIGKAKKLGHAPDVAKKDPSTGKVKKRSASIADAQKAAMALIKMSKGDHVSKEEYIRRVNICNICPMKTAHSECWGCGGSGRAAKAVQAMRAKLGLGFPVDERIARNYCGFCGCSLPLLLVTKVENYKVETSKDNKSRPITCWLRRDSFNFNGE